MFLAPAGFLILRHTVNSNVGSNYDLYDALGNPPGPFLLLFTVESAGRIRGLDMRGFPDNTKVRMVHSGHIYGVGGNGGSGEIFENTPPDPITSVAATAGTAGGHGIRLDGNIEVWLTLEPTGKIYGAGGGEGGWGCAHTIGSHTGPGGGGGSEGGQGGTGNPNGADSTGSGVAANPGGNAGDFGQAGDAGEDNGGTGAAGGAAGKAISLGGGTLHLTNNGGEIIGAIS